MSDIVSTVLGFVRGDGIRWEIFLEDENGDPVNCAGAVARFVARPDYPDPDTPLAPQIDLTTDNPTSGLTWQNDAEGQLQLILPHTVTATLNAICTQFQLLVNDSANQPITVALGTLEPDFRNLV